MPNILGLEIISTGHAGFIVKEAGGAGKKIAFDPFMVRLQEPVDILFITHSHHDHCSIADVEKLIGPETIIVAPPDCQSKLSNLKFRNMLPVEPGKSYRVKGVRIETVPAYNTNKSFHRRESGWVGYVVEFSGKRIFHAGDTDATPEIAALEDIDIAFIPVSGTYVMTAEEAAKITNKFKPKFAVPMHYGVIVGDKKDAEKFKRMATEAEVVVID